MIINKKKFLLAFDMVYMNCWWIYEDEEEGQHLIFNIDQGRFEDEVDILNKKYIEKQLEYSNFYTDLSDILRKKYWADFISL